MENVLTIIPARGGSKSIPKKNLKYINGKTLIERAVISALKIPDSKTIVSTDDIEILETLKDYPITVLGRSETNSTDLASSESVILEVLDKIDSFDGIIVLLQATSPFVDIKSLKVAINRLRKSESIDSMFSAVQKNEFIWELEDIWVPKNHERSARLPRQLRNLTAVETGSFYLFKSRSFLEEKTRFCGVTEPAFTGKWSDFDVDTQEDLDLCRELSKVLDFPPYLV
jgi:N-acylneuraminate cytidylyltransferase